MKRWLSLLLSLLILTGCAIATDPTTTQTSVQSGETQEATGGYDPGSMLEISTSGSVQVFSTGRDDCTGMIPTGDGLLLLSGTEVTTLTLLSGETLHAVAAVTLPVLLDADAPALWLSSEGFSYYDPEAKELVFLDNTLAEFRRYALPEGTVGSPALTEDAGLLYYCTENALRVIDLDTGLDKLLKEMSFSARSISGLHWGESILQCAVTDRNGQELALFLSTETGETLYQHTGPIRIFTTESDYFAIRPDGAYTELLTGTQTTGPQLLTYDDTFCIAGDALDQGSAVMVYTDTDEKTTRFECVDIHTGLSGAMLTVPGNTPVRCVRGSAGGYIWFIRYDSGYGCDIVCRWDSTQNPVSDDTGILDRRYTLEDPDLEELRLCAVNASALSLRHHVEILVWTDVESCATEAYPLTPEHQVSSLRSALEQLDQALSRYPKSLLEQIGAATKSGKLRICLVRDIGTGTAGVQYWTEDSICITLCAGEDLEQTLHHQLFYALDNRVLGNCNIYDDWNSLNPANFQYTLEESGHEAFAEENPRWFTGKNRAFADSRAVTFSRTDRATVMEYAMMPGNETVFASETMQLKLRKLCDGLRAAFDLEDVEEAFHWEQYLTETDK